MHNLNINYWRVLLVAVIYAIISQIVHSVSSMLTMSYYMIEEYWPVWSKIMMPTAGPPPMSFFLYSLLFAFIAGLLFAYVYNMIKKSMPGKTVCKGLHYGILVFLIAGIPSTLGYILLINLPIALLLYWALEMLIIYLVMRIITAKLIK